MNLLNLTHPLLHRRDNDLIYLATPTASTLLPPIVPFPLAKPLIAAELADPLGYLNQIQRPGWLRALVPRRTRDALELWEDRKMVWYGEVVDRGAKKLETEANRCARCVLRGADHRSSCLEYTGTDLCRLLCPPRTAALLH